jgi:isopenicillin N synthase-like dioxygenase
VLESWPPVVDLRDHRSSIRSRQARARRQTAEACEAYGLFLLSGHGLDPGLLAAIRARSMEFFDAPAPYKCRFHYEGTSRGYTPLCTESLAATGMDSSDATPPDVKEAFAVGSVDIFGRAEAARGRGAQPVTWPSQPVDFKDAWVAYFRAARALAADIMALLRDALDAPSAIFENAMRDSADFLRVINYPDQPEPPSPGMLRAGEHTDFGALTILACDAAPGGLQARTAAGDWRDVPYRPDCLVVNIGDLMSYWTGHRWLSAVHRVINPPDAARARSRRQSVIFFHNPRPDAVIEPLTRTGSERLPHIIAGDWLRAKTARQRLPCQAHH